MNTFLYKKTLVLVVFFALLFFLPIQTYGQVNTSLLNEPPQNQSGFTSTDIDLVWEALESYTPPFYQGKALHPGWGPVRITAVPHIYKGDGEKVNKRNLSYTWKYNDLVYGGESGRGVDSFTINTVPRTGNEVTVDVKTVEGELIASESVTLPIANPEIVFYRQDPLTGTLLSKALNNSYSLESTNEVTLRAVPYFFLADSPTTPGLSYSWEINREAVNPSGEQDTLTLRRQGGVGGEANIGVSIEDTSRIFPDISSTINIVF